MEKVFEILDDKKEVINFLLKTILDADKTTNGLRSIVDGNQTQEFKVNKLLQVTANQNVQIQRLAVLVLIYAQSDSLDTDIAKLMNKLGRGEEALQKMLKKKMEL